MIYSFCMSSIPRGYFFDRELWSDVRTTAFVLAIQDSSQSYARTMARTLLRHTRRFLGEILEAASSICEDEASFDFAVTVYGDEFDNQDNLDSLTEIVEAMVKFVGGCKYSRSNDMDIDDVMITIRQRVHSLR